MALDSGPGLGLSLGLDCPGVGLGLGLDCPGVGLGLGFESCTDNFLASPSNYGPATTAKVKF